MAKVMVSMPDDLLAAVDAAAERQGITRSGYLRELAEGELGRAVRRRMDRMVEIQYEVDGTGGHGGGVAELVKDTRPQR